MKNILFASTALITGAVSVAQGAQTAGPVLGLLTRKTQATPDFVALPPKGSGDVSAKVLVERTPLEIAPESVFFEATDLEGWDAVASATGYNPQDHDLIYLWNFGDEGAAYTVPVNVLSQWQNANKGYGRRVTHVYGTPGTYTPSVLIIEPTSGKNITLRLDPITVGNANTVYANNRTIFVSGDSNHTDRPINSDYSSTFADAVAKGAGKDCRIMLARGEMHSTGKVDVRNLKNFMICASPGAGPKPILSKTTTDNKPLMEVHYNYTGAQIIVDNVRLESGWDSTTETGGDRAATFLYLHAQTSVNFLMTGCESSGFIKTISWLNQQSGDVAKGSRFTMHDSFLTNWQDYGFYIEACSRIAFLGNRITQHVDALSGGPKNYNPPTNNNHGPGRFQLFIPHHVYMDGNDLFTRCGWFPNIDAVRTEQPCIRANMAQRTDSMYHICRTTMEGGDVCIVNSPMTSNISTRLSPMVIEMNYFVGSYQTRHFVLTASSGLTIRNNVGIKPNTPVIGPKDWIAFAFTYGGDASNHAPIKVYHNTYINLGQDGQDEPFFDNNGSNAPVMEADNITHAPQFQTPIVSFASLDQTPRWTPRHKGYKNKNDDSFHAEYATPKNTVWNATPLEGSPVLGAATIEDAIYTDLSGRIRPAYPSIGAFEIQN